jgi:hypothetical protein
MFEESNNFYTPSGIHVFTKDAMMNDLVDLDVVISNLEAKLPDHIRDGVEQFGMEIYADQEIKDEFLRKRMHLYNILWNMGFKAPREMFLDTEYDQEFDEFLVDDVGYDKMSEILKGIMITPYAATSLREYFATGFTEFYLYPDSHGYLQKTSPELYTKLVQLHKLGDA